MASTRNKSTKKDFDKAKSNPELQDIKEKKKDIKSLPFNELLDYLTSEASGERKTSHIKEEIMNRMQSNKLQQERTEIMESSIEEIKTLIKEEVLSILTELSTGHSDQILQSKNELVSAIKETIKNTLQELSPNIQLSSSSSSSFSYAEVTKFPPLPRRENGLLICPSNPKEPIQVLEKHLNSLNIKEISFESRRTRNGKLLIKPSSDQDKCNLLSELENIGDKLHISELKPRLMNIIIFDAPQCPSTQENNNEHNLNSYQEDFLNPALKKALKVESVNYKLLRVMRSRDGMSSNLVVQLEDKLASILLQQQRIQIGFLQCRMQQYFSIPRCTQCQMFEHTKKNCPNDIYCANCAKKHPTSECTLPFGDPHKSKCINCDETNRKDPSTYRNVNHPATWGGCPIFRQLLAQMKNNRSTKRLQQNLPKTRNPILTSPNDRPVQKSQKQPNSNLTSGNTAIPGTSKTTANSSASGISNTPFRSSQPSKNNNYEPPPENIPITDNPTSPPGLVLPLAKDSNEHQNSRSQNTRRLTSKSLVHSRTRPNSR